MTLILLILICLPLLLGSCSSEKELTDCFDVEETLVPQTAAFENDSILNPTMMRIVDGRLFLCNLFTSPLMTVFDCKSGKWVEHFGNKGVGAGEFIDINTISELDSALVLYDNNKSECILIDDIDSLSKNVRVNIPKGEDVHPFNIVGLSEGLLLGTGVFKDGRFALYRKDGTFLSVFGEYPKEDGSATQNYISNAFAYQSNVAYNPSRNCLAVGNCFGEGISFYDLSDISSLALIREIQLRYPAYQDASKGESWSVTFAKENIIGFLDLVPYKDSFIGLYCGEIRERGKMWKGGNMLLVFDCSGNPVKKVTLPQKYMQLSICDSELYLLGIDSMTDDYTIHEVNLNELIG